MNRPLSFSTPSFTFLPQNPNPNASFSHPFLSNPQPLPPQPSTETFISPPNTDLQTTISHLKDLIDLADNTANSVSDFLHSEKNPIPNDDFCSCPFDPRHRMLPEFLFRHSLRCPSSPRVLDLRFLKYLHYPNSLKSEHELQKENRFVQSLQVSDADLCFSLDEYGDFGSNFFYKDCPGVVSSPEQDSTRITFTLPGILSVECANFVFGRGDREIRVLPMIFASELWALRREVEVWNDYPSFYSYTALRVASCLYMVAVYDSLKWLISNSLKYGIVIDVSMRDHVFLLLKLCLKAISREAFSSLELLSSRRACAEEGGGLNNINTFTFQCPRLVESLMWLASQLSILYGETNGRFFVIDILRQCLLSVGSHLLLFPLGQESVAAVARKETCGNVDVSFCERAFESVESEFVGDVKVENIGESSSRESDNLFDGDGSGQVFVSQVAAAVAALHERSLLEERIRELRQTGSRSKFQMVDEHLNASRRAYEERAKRPDYRPILEHDGLLWQRSRNQDLNKTKSREELLAEERDYKRRRMSYRGKKLKRTTTQVMRDIIEQHMEEIKQAGGIGCFVKGAGESWICLPTSSSANDTTADVDALKSSAYDSSESIRRHSLSGRSDNAFTNQQSAISSGLKDIRSRQRHEVHVQHEPWEDHKRNISNGREDYDYSPRNPQGYRRSRERYGHQREKDDTEATRSKFDRNGSSHRSKYHDNRSFSSSSNTANDLSKRKCDQMAEIKDRPKSRTYGSHRSESVSLEYTFDDRYDPSLSYDRHEETCGNVSPKSKYVKPDRLYSPSNDVRYHNEQHKSDYSPKLHRHDHH